MMSRKENEIEIQRIKKLQSEDSVLITLEKVKGASLVWQKFKRIFENGNPSNFVQCINCKVIYVHNESRNPGTSNLSKHECVENDARPSLITSHFDRKPRTNDKYILADAIAYFCAIEIKPYSTTTGDGFVKLAQTLIDIGARGKVNAKEILPCSNTISDHIGIIYYPAAQKLKDHFKGIKSFSSTTDHWKDDKTQREFIGVTVHYIHNSTLISRVLAVIEIDSKKAADTIIDWSYVQKEFGIENKVIFIFSTRFINLLVKSQCITRAWTNHSIA